MRSVCFVDRLEIDFSGTIHADAVALGDIDNDGENELVVGTINGDLSIYKGEKLWQTITGLGMITSVGVGDIMKCGSNAVVAVSGEGWCHFYMCINQNKLSPCEKLHLVYQRRIPTNTKVMVLGDIQGDGQIDMILGLTDRVVRIYRWLQTREVASLVCLNKCECAGQIGSVCIGRDKHGKPCVLVSQPGSTYMTISNSYEEDPLVEYHEVPLPRLVSSNICSQIVGSLDDDQSICIISLDGTIAFINDQKLLWTQHLDQQLFKGGRISVCGDDPKEQLVSAAWSGNTFIIDRLSNVVCFEMGEAIQSFTSGPYANHKTTTFVYVTYGNKILVYYDIFVESMVLRTLTDLQLLDPELAKFSPEELRQLTQYCLYHFDDDDEEIQKETEMESSIETQVNTQGEKNVETQDRTMVETQGEIKAQAEIRTKVESGGITLIQTEGLTITKTDEMSNVGTAERSKLQTEEMIKLETADVAKVETEDVSKVQTEEATQVESVEVTMVKPGKIRQAKTQDGTGKRTLEETTREIQHLTKEKTQHLAEEETLLLTKELQIFPKVETQEGTNLDIHDETQESS